MAHTFLSREWFEALDEIHDEMPAPAPVMKDLVLNTVVQGGPEGDTEARLDGGHFAPGLADDAPTKLFVPTTSPLHRGRPQAAMQAFVSGKIRVEGDISKMLAMQAGTQQSPEQDAFQKELQDITA